MTEKWSKDNFFGLAHLASRRSSELVALSVNANDLVAQRRHDELVEAIYEAMRAAGINYGLEPAPPRERNSSHAPYQFVRMPEEIMVKNKREGTCLDLALFFSGVCLGYGLLPVLIVLGDPEGVKDNRHVVVAVSRNLGLRDWDQREPKEYSLLLKVPVGREAADEVSKLILKEAYVAVECTGVASGESFISTFPEGKWREPDGTMLFESAKRAGVAHFDKPQAREFLSAIDYGTVYRYYEIDPLAGSDAGGRTIRRFDEEQSGGRTPEADPLRYIIDRGEQEQALKEAVFEQRARAPKRPLVCVIHGDEAECHDNFLTRLRLITLPKIVGFWQRLLPDEVSVQTKTMELSLGGLTDENWERVLWGDFAAAVTNARDATPASVVEQISRCKPTFMIDVPLFSERLQGVSLEQLDYFFRFWGKLPPLPEDLLLIVCLSLKYQDKFERGWRRPWGALNDKLKRYVRELNFGAFDGVEGVCLPQLKAVTQTDATSAVKHRLAERYRLFEDDVIRLYRHSSMRDAEGRIPMDELIYQLRRLGNAAINEVNYAA
jgi:hypothetical protein